ncbi:MAG: hypothetical protein II497_01525 [Lachnospiraceae bacterium]|nr:hypothetical protein [Lachnospiraceae bacterium]
MTRFVTEKGDFAERGPKVSGNDVLVSAVADIGTVPAVELYSRKDRKKIATVRFPKDSRVGSVYSMRIKDVDSENTLFRIRSGKKEYIDPYTRYISGNDRFGKRDAYGSFICPRSSVSHRGPHIEWQDVILYQLNVRSYTKDRTSGVKHPGTFDGLREKIPYMKKLGVTTLILQPAYDFDEVGEVSMDGVRRLNLWGYVPGNYFVPKPSYAAADPAKEFMDLVEERHVNRMEIVMQLYFLPEHNLHFIQDVLRHWVMVYGVDGFELLGAELPVKGIVDDPYMTDTKLIFNDIDEDMIYGRSTPRVMNVGIACSPFMYDMRKYLKGDEDMLGRVSKHMLYNPEKTAVINYITTYLGFTLKDLVSYDRKHNEKNGEGGADGSDYNYSWNCGDEGNSRKKAVNSLRLRQMKNAMMLLILSQGVPMLRAGDEFCNSQKGNNNPWCQDNRISYLDWTEAEKNRDFLKFVIKLISVRRAHPVLHGRYSKKLYDYISCGVPDASYHGEQAWNQSFANYNRHFALMYAGYYEKRSDGKNDDSFYIAYNMHWTGHRFHPPKPAKGRRWEILMSSGEGRESGIYDADRNELAVYQRSIVILMTKDAGSGK